METVYLVGIDAGPSEMLDTYANYTHFLNTHRFPLTTQSRAVFGGKEIHRVDDLASIIKPDDIIIIGGQRESYLSPLAKLNCYRVYVMEYVGAINYAPDERWHLSLCCDLKHRRNDWNYVTNPFLAHRISKLVGIKQPQNGRAFYALQASDDPTDELKSIFAFKHWMDVYGHLFSEIILKPHPNTVTNIQEFIREYNKRTGAAVKEWSGIYDLEGIYKSFQYIASHSSSITLHGLLAGLGVFHCIDPQSLEIQHFTEIKPYKMSCKLPNNPHKHCKRIDDFIFDRWVERTKFFETADERMITRQKELFERKRVVI